jgi:exosome complex exonuclease DIS3/RRP44
LFQVRAANQMVEEMMLLANVAAAAASLAACPGAALLRRHPTPPPRQFAPLLAAAAAAGTPLDATTSRSLANSLDAAVRVGDPVFNRLVRILATRSMTPAQYYAAASVPAPADRAHYGLACGLYTHFTSPIRRYADVVVHRLLAASINAAPTPPSARDPAAHESVATAINVRHRGAQLAARASVELHTLIFFKTRATVADARVVRVRANGVVVFVPKFGIEGPAYFDGAEAGALPPGVDEGGAAAASGDWTLTPDGCAACPPGTDTPAVRVFDVATVRIAVEDGGRGGGRPRLTLTLVPRAELAPGEAAE